MITQKEFEQKWHYKKVKSKGYYKIPDVEYYVTACLLDSAPESNCFQLTKFAIMACDYSSENRNWLTFDLAPEEVDKLDERFEILGDYNNIDFEILFEFLDFDENGDFVVAYKNFTGNIENNMKVPKFTFNDVNKGDKIFDIGWKSTTGEKLKKSYYLKKSDWDGLNTQQIYDKFENVRNWIRGGLYHFGDKF